MGRKSIDISEFMQRAALHALEGILASKYAADIPPEQAASDAIKYAQALVNAIHKWDVQTHNPPRPPATAG